MKPKVFYLICYAVALSGILASAIVIARQTLLSGGVIVGRTALPSNLPRGPEPEVFQKAMEFEPILTSLARPGALLAKGVDLSAFGYQNIREASGPFKGRKMMLRKELTHSVSFAFCGGRKCFCVVDGTFYPEGAVLDSGGKILRILPRKVLIEEGQVRKWFPVGAGMGKNANKETEPGREK